MAHVEWLVEFLTVAGTRCQLSVLSLICYCEWVEIVKGFIEMMMECSTRASIFWFCANMSLFSFYLFIYLFIFLFLFKYSCLHFCPPLPHPNHLHFPPSILSTFGFVHVSFIVPENPSPSSPHYPLPLPSVTVSLFLISNQIWVFLYVVCIVFLFTTVCLLLIAVYSYIDSQIVFVCSLGTLFFFRILKITFWFLYFIEILRKH